MSRLKNFPSSISIGMKADGKLIILPEKADWAIFAKEQIKKVEVYSLGSVPVVKRQRKPSTKSSKNTQEKPEQKEAMFHCNACNRDIDNPKTSNGKPQCPECLVVGKIVGKDE